MKAHELLTEERIRRRILPVLDRYLAAQRPTFADRFEAFGHRMVGPAMAAIALLYALLEFYG